MKIYAVVFTDRWCEDWGVKELWDDKDTAIERATELTLIREYNPNHCYYVVAEYELNKKYEELGWREDVWSGQSLTYEALNNNQT